MNVILMGPPGSGKGTQSQYFADQKAFKTISTGDLFRKALREETSLGRQAQRHLDKGQLVPDELTIGLVREVLGNSREDTSLLLDGFPRTLAQATALDQMLSEKNQKVDLVLSLEVPDSLVIDRLTGRRWAPQSGRIYHIRNQAPKRAGFCDETGEPLVIREDDREEVVKNRLEIFKKQDRILKDYYRPKRLLQEIPAEASPDEVFKKILPLLEG